MNRIGMLITALLLTSTNIMAQEEEDFDVRGHIEHIGTGQMLSPQKGMRRRDYRHCSPHLYGIAQSACNFSAIR